MIEERRHSSNIWLFWVACDGRSRYVITFSDRQPHSVIKFHLLPSSSLIRMIFPKPTTQPELIIFRNSWLCKRLKILESPSKGGSNERGGSEIEVSALLVVQVNDIVSENWTGMKCENDRWGECDSGKSSWTSYRSCSSISGSWYCFRRSHYLDSKRVT